MGLRFRKSISLMKGVKLNLGTTGASLSLGTKGVHYNISSTGRRTTTFSVPGTGLSYVTTSSAGGTKKKPTPVSQGSQGSAGKTANDDERAAVEEYENYVAYITGLHRSCDEPIDWEMMEQAAPPFVADNGPRLLEAENALMSYKPTMTDRFTHKDEEIRAELQRAVDEARAQEGAVYAQYEVLHRLAPRVRKGDIEAYYEAVDMLQPYADLREFGSSFLVGTDNPEFLEIEYTIRSEDVIPQRELSLTDSGRLSDKAMPAKKAMELLLDFVCSCTVRVARDTFALLPVNTVVIHVVRQMLDEATGKDTEVTVLSVRFRRDSFADIVFERVDASAFTEHQECRMNFKKTLGFQPVERIDTEDNQ